MVEHKEWNTKEIKGKLWLNHGASIEATVVVKRHISG